MKENDRKQERKNERDKYSKTTTGSMSSSMFDEERESTCCLEK